MAVGPLGGRGWRVITFLLLGAACYFGVGVYLNGRNEGKHGVEAIPHIRYWEEVPSLVREGMQFSYAQGRAYSEVAMPYAHAGFEKAKALYGELRSKYPAGSGYSAPGASTPSIA